MSWFTLHTPWLPVSSATRQLILARRLMRYSLMLHQRIMTLASPKYVSHTLRGSSSWESKKDFVLSLSFPQIFSALSGERRYLWQLQTLRKLHLNRNSTDCVNWTSSKESAYLFCPSPFSSLLYWYFRISAKSLRGWEALYLWTQVIAVFPYFATDAASIVIVDRRPAARPWEVTLYMVSPPLDNKMGKVNDIQLW